jgi:purine-binding chemotaxis protein CheW
MTDDTAIGRRLAGLRDAFDLSFAEPPASGEGALEKFLAVRVAGARHVFRLAEVNEVAADRRVTPIPARISELRGLTAVRGRLTPVYSLAALLGESADAGSSRWLVVVAQAQLALALDRVDGYVLGRPDDIVRAAGNGTGKSFETLRRDETSFGILSVPSLVERIETRIASTRKTQEH